MGSIINNKILETHGRANHLLIKTDTPTISNCEFHLAEPTLYESHLADSTNCKFPLDQCTILYPILEKLKQQLLPFKVVQHSCPKPKLEPKLAAPHGDNQSTHRDGPSNPTHFASPTPITPKSNPLTLFQDPLQLPLKPNA
jgi:hypothetical protein